MHIYRLIVIMTSLSGLLFAQAEEVSFEQMWQIAQKEQAEIKAVELDVELASLKRATVARHWQPQIYLSSSYAMSDDSGFGMFAKLQQREILNADFVDTDLNKSEMDYLFSTAIGVRVNLFEGFKFKHLGRATKLEQEAQEIRLRHTRKSKFAALLTAYNSLIVNGKYQERLREANKRITKTVKRYKVGRRSNPVGHSGILGLRALANKTEILLNQVEAEIVQLRGEIEVLAPSLKTGWTVSTIPFMGLLKAHTPKMSSDFLTGVSDQLQMRDKMEGALVEAAESLNSAYWPSVGAFAESKMILGDRGNTDVNTMGIQVTWNLYDPASFSNGQIARAKKSKEQWITSEYRKKEQTGRRTLYTSYKVAIDSLRVMNKNKELLDEQLKISQRLFRSGVMNAITLSQVFSKYCDLVNNLVKVERQVIAIHAQVYTLAANNK